MPNILPASERLLAVIFPVVTLADVILPWDAMTLPCTVMLPEILALPPLNNPEYIGRKASTLALL